MNHLIDILVYQISFQQSMSFLNLDKTLAQSSGSGSESGTHTRKYEKSRSNCAADNNSGSSNENEYGSRSLSVRDGSDQGSGTQVLHCFTTYIYFS